MTVLQVHLFGMFCAQHDDEVVEGLTASKVQELFSYLLVYRGRSHQREALAGLLWGESNDVQARKYLRHTLWKLQAALNVLPVANSGELLQVDADSIYIPATAAIWLDTAAFEQAFNLTSGIAGRELNAQQAGTLRQAVDLYGGDLLEGCYQEWCLCERERLQHTYLVMLDKLVDYYEAQHDYENGLHYASRGLGHDRARERTHRRLMRLHYQAGDRTAALRQYESCRAVLRDEFGVAPLERTVTLYEQIRSDRPVEQLAGPIAPGPAQPSVPGEVVARLRKIQASLGELQQQVAREIAALERTGARN